MKLLVVAILQISALFYLFTMVGSYVMSANTIQGIPQHCDNEGKRVSPSMMNIHCFYCECKNHQVECKRNSCPEEDCFMLTNVTDSQGCCKMCKGCYYQGKFYESGTEWRDPTDPCLMITCKAGVITESTVQCYTPCHNPIAPKQGECCPRCPGCRLNGRTFTAGKKIKLEEDPCLKCSCDGVSMTCTKTACPVLQCSQGNMIQHPGECCPRCNGTREVYPPPRGRCLLGNDVRKVGETVPFDKCTFCSCLNSTSICRRDSCPPLNCPLEKQFYPSNESCCLQCPLYYETNKTVCQVGDKIYRDRQTWQSSECKTCTCNRGQMYCTIEDCPSSNVPCPPNMRLHKEPGACCKKCLEDDGVCTVFGDPHYKTFDGQFYSFQGSCKYQLTGDCIHNTFSIRVTNDGRSTKTSSWTKTVSIKMGSNKITLGDKMRVKINKVRISAPYANDFVNVTKSTYSTLVQTHIGVKIVWDGNSFLEVSVPISYKGRLCGLCGNYNSNPRDDFIAREGYYAVDAMTFASSWQVGGRKACQRPEPHRRPSCSHSRFRRMGDRRCKSLKNRTFANCHDKLNPDIYFKSCLVDMCECPSKKCYCESLTAYAHECQRLGILPPSDWRTTTGCSISDSGFY